MFFLFFVFIFSSFNFPKDDSFENGKKLFSVHCISCHINKNNIIIPEKNLKLETLKTFGINNTNSIVYQIINGKNGMPAFGGRLKQNEIENITSYLLK